MKRIAFAFLAFLAQTSFAQNFTVSGFLTDSSSGKKILYASIVIEELEKGLTTDEFGFYNFSIPKGDYTVIVDIVGYQTFRKKIKVNKDRQFNITLTKKSENIDVVEIESDRKETDENLKKAEVGIMKVEIEELNKIPVILGEKDALKTIQLLPGITPASEGSSDFVVRGGNADQNLMLLDEAPIYNPGHVLGFLSVFNSDAISDLKLYKSGAPARYGGRSSSVIDVSMREGNDEEFHFNGGLGYLTSRLSLEGPIVKNKGSFIISGRRSWADMIIKAIPKKKLQGVKPKIHMYDFNFKANYELSSKDKIFLSSYVGRDVLAGKMDSIFDFGINYGNKTVSLGWSHLFNEKLISNTTAIYSSYDIKVLSGEKSQEFEVTSGIVNLGVKQYFSYLPNLNNTIRFGLELNNQSYNPMKVIETENGVISEFQTDPKQGLEAAIFLQNDQKIGDNFQMNYGLRLSSMNLYGKAKHHEFDKNGNITNTHQFKKNEFYKTYVGLEPRFNSSYQLNKVSAIKSSYSRMFQYSNKISQFSLGTPIDYWVPVTPTLNPGITDQVSLGYHRNFRKNKYEAFVEVYYKKLQNLIAFKDGADPFITDLIESQIEVGKGRAYGVELFLKKRTGRFTGWISYTLSQSDRKFNNINKGQWFQARLSKNHDLSIVGIYELSKKVTVSASWVFSTGEARAFQNGNYSVGNITVPLNSERNSYRLPNYHRLDIGATYKLRSFGKIQNSLNLSVYNAYFSRNAYFMWIGEDPFADSPEKKAYTFTLLGIIPSVNWNFKF